MVGCAGVVSVIGGLGVGDLKPFSLRLCNTADMVMLLGLLVSESRTKQSSFPVEYVGDGDGEGEGESWREEDGFGGRGWARDE